MNVIIKYFPNLSIQQVAQFEALFPLYMDWNSKINVISRKDIENLYVHHVLHSLAIAKIIPLLIKHLLLTLALVAVFLVFR